VLRLRGLTDRRFGGGRRTRFGGGRRTSGPGSSGRVETASADGPGSDDPGGVLALLEAVGGGDSAEIFRRAVEKDMRELIDRSRRLRADLALTPEVANPILVEALASVRAQVDSAAE
jgi:hypothetical protein